MVYRTPGEDVIASQDKFKKEYPPFIPFVASKKDNERILKLFNCILRTQNGVDTDDYPVNDDNPVEKYLSKIERNSKLLLLGAGAGREILVAEEMDFSVIGTTLGSRNIAYGNKYLNLSSDKHIECLNENIPFPNEYFDVIAGFQVFEHCVAPIIFLLEQYRLLKMGGKLILEWPPPKKYTFAENPHHLICYTPGQAKALFQKSGFSNIEMVYEDLTEIPEEDYWRGEQDKMMCISGVKAPSTEKHIIEATQ